MNKGGLQKKIGPLKLWHWIAIGAALGLGILIYKSNRESSEPTGELFGGTGTGAFGPIDPETGIPYAFEAGAGGLAAGETLDEFLGRVQQLQDSGLLGGGGGESEVLEGPETFIERIVNDSPMVAAAKQQQKAKSKEKHNARGGGKGNAGSGAQGKGRATSTGAGAAQGGASHTAAPHPAQRIGIGGAVGVAGPGKGTKQGGGKQQTVKKNTPIGGGGNKGGGGGGKKGGGGGGGGGGGNKGGGGKKKK